MPGIESDVPELWNYFSNRDLFRRKSARKYTTRDLKKSHLATLGWFGGGGFNLRALLSKTQLLCAVQYRYTQLITMEKSWGGREGGGGGKRGQVEVWLKVKVLDLY